MTFALEIPLAVIALATLAAGASLGVAWWWRRRPDHAEPPAAAEIVTEQDEAAVLRSFALDAVGEAVLIVGGDGRVRDCNSAALALLDRHRANIEEQFASTLRRFEVMDPDDPPRVACEHALWTGEAWVRQPDGSTRLCHARVMAMRDRTSEVIGYVESYRDAINERAMGEEFRNLLYGVRIYEAATTLPDANLRAIREELRLLGEAFHGLDHVIRQYERLLPSLSADDPLAEAIAGAAHDARAAVSQVGVPGLLEEIPRSLARLRSHLQRLSELLLEAQRTSARVEPAEASSPVATGRGE